MGEPVGKHRVAAPDQRSDHTGIGLIAAREQQGGFAADKIGKVPLEPVMRRQVSGQQMG